MILELLLNGIVEGSLLALICIGYSLAYGSAKVVNFAHADVMIAGGGYLVLMLSAGTTNAIAIFIMVFLFGMACCATVWQWISKWNVSAWSRFLCTLMSGLIVAGLTYGLNGRLPFIVALLLAIPLTAFLAAGIYQIGYLPLIRCNAPRTSVLLSALGFSIAIESLLLVGWGSQRRVFPQEMLPDAIIVRSVPSTLPEGMPVIDIVNKYGVIPLTKTTQLPVHDFLILFIFFIVTLALFLFFRYSRIADAIIATADSRLGARSCGIPVDQILSYAFLLGGAIASLGGTLLILRAKSLYPTSGFSPGILAFAACVLGGIGSLRGSVAGAFLVSLIISLSPAIPLNEWAGRLLPYEWLRWAPSLNLSDWSYGVIYILMIVTILLKPKGLFSR